MFNFSRIQLVSACVIVILGIVILGIVSAIFCALSRGKIEILFSIKGQHVNLNAFKETKS